MTPIVVPEPKVIVPVKVVQPVKVVAPVQAPVVKPIAVAPVEQLSELTPEGFESSEGYLSEDSVDSGPYYSESQERDTEHDQPVGVRQKVVTTGEVFYEGEDPYVNYDVVVESSDDHSHDHHHDHSHSHDHPDHYAAAAPEVFRAEEDPYVRYTEPVKEVVVEPEPVIVAPPKPVVVAPPKPVVVAPPQPVYRPEPVHVAPVA